MRRLSGVFMLLVSACSTGRSGGVDPMAEDPNAPVRIYVTNNHGYPVEIYAAGQGTSYRVGTVLPGQAEKFSLRPGMIGHGPVELIARGSPGAQPARSRGMMLNPGDIVDFDIATHMLNSMATIRAIEHE